MKVVKADVDVVGSPVVLRSLWTQSDIELGLELVLITAGDFFVERNTPRITRLCLCVSLYSILRLCVCARTCVCVESVSE